ncbi:tail fiber protein [Escherichia phage Ebrios]|uniref:Tail fiber protein n=1 Tax=Escherichia phage Ebrios TaxID=2099356 RepID=A0A2P1CLG0_9CAUD|nr:tail fiber protein [Escherichia phage Ebrios]AVJ51925.1 tail fiber protein [Escherichia phage Ebrios]
MANVIKTVLTYPLDGSTTDFNIPFEYLARKFVVVTLLGADRRVLTLPTDYRFATRTVIATNKAWGPADGYTQIEIRRVTSATERLVDFTDGSILRAYDLNVAQIQTMHVAEEARNMTADTIGVNNDGHLDARGRRIVNLAYATSDYDAVPLKQIKEREFSAWNAVTKANEHADRSNKEANSSRDEANRAQREADRSTQQAGVSTQQAVESKKQADRSGSEANRAKGYADGMTASVAEAKTQADRSGSEANRASDGANRAAGEVTKAAAEVAKAAAHVETAKGHADRANVEANRSKGEADRAKSEANRAQQAVQYVKDLGAVPVGTIAMFGTAAIPAGWLSLMEDDPIFDVRVYPDLARLYPTGHLPSYKDRVPEGVGSGITLGQKRAGNVGVTSAIMLQTDTVDLNHSHDFSGSTTSGGEHEHFINSLNQRSDSGVYPTIEWSNWRSPNPPNWTKTAIGGKHSHSVSGITAGMKNGVGQKHNHTISGVVGSGRNLVDATGTIFAIKAFGTVANEGSLDAPALSGSIQRVNNRVSTLETAVGYGRKVNISDLLVPATGWTFNNDECPVLETASGYIVRAIFRGIGSSGSTTRNMCTLKAGLKCVGYSAAVVYNPTLPTGAGYVELLHPNYLAVAGSNGPYGWVMATLTLEKV